MIHRHILENGARLLVQPSAAAPLVSIYFWTEAGSVDELPGEEGAAHLLEHMLFKGTSRRGVGEAAGEIEGLGGDLNAYTSFEQTVVHATIEASAWRSALDVVVDMVRNSVVDPAELEREKVVVLEEIRGYQDEPEVVVAETALALVYPGHAYGRPIVGTVESVTGIDRDRLMGFRNRCYGPARTVIAVAGDVEAQAVVDALTALLDGWNGAETRGDVPTASPMERAILGVDRPFATAAVEMNWRTPPLGHPDIPALDVLTTGLGTGQASALVVRLQLEDGLVGDVSVGLSARHGGGDLSIGLIPHAGQTEAAIAATLDEIDAVVRRGLTAAEVSRARDGILADFLFGAETVDGLAHDLAWYEARYADPEERERYRKAVAAVTPADVHRVARAWLQTERLVVAALDPKLGAKALAKSTAIRPTPPPPRREPTCKVLDNGVTIWVLPDDTPVSALRIAGIGGELAQDARTAGIVSAWAQLVTAGAGDRDATAFAEAIDSLAGTLDGSGGRNSMGLVASFPADRLLDGLELVGSAVVEPRFEAEEWTRVRDDLIEDAKTIGDRPGLIADQAMWSALWRGHPWRLPPWGTEASLGRIGPTSIRRWHERLFRGENLVVGVAGGVEPEAVFDTLGPWLSELPAGPAELPERPTPGPVRAGHRLQTAGREQAQVLWSVRSCDLHDPDRFPLLVAAGLLGSQGGRLFMALRETRSLAYSVWAQSLNGLDGGVFVAGLATEPARAEEARDALRAELHRLVDEPPSPEEVARARRMLVGHTAMGLQRAQGRASDVALGVRYGLPWGLDAFRTAVDRVDVDALVGAMQRVLARPVVEVVVEPSP